MLSKTEIIVLEIFTSRINKKFNTKEISKITKKPYPLIHRTLKILVDKRFITRDHNLFCLNYNENHPALAYIESIRANRFLDKHKTIHVFFNDVFDKLKLGFFSLIVFGSYAENKQTAKSDADILLVIENISQVEEFEKLLDYISSNFTAQFHCHVISVESVYEMLKNSKEKNVMNETLNKHIILYGAENYYRWLKNAG